MRKWFAVVDRFCNRASGTFSATSSTSVRPSLSRSPTASPRASRRTCQGLPARSETSTNRPPVAEQELRSHLVRDRRAEVGDVAVGLDQVDPAVVVRIQGREPEAEDLRRRRGEPHLGRPVAENPAAVVVIERRRLVEEIGHRQVDPSVAVEVAAGHAHPRQIAARLREPSPDSNPRSANRKPPRLWKK